MEASKAQWQVATLLEAHMTAANVRSMRFSLSEWKPFMAGQHYDIRLTAPNGYMAERSYSIASAPEEKGSIEFGIQLLANGEVSPYLFSLKPGEKIEVRGPIGGHFVWSTDMPGPLVLIGGGSGMVPLMSMLRHHAHHEKEEKERDIVFLISARSLELVLYREELETLQAKNPKLKVHITLTDSRPSDWKGYSRRIDEDILKETVLPYLKAMPMSYICGPTRFVESVATTMVKLGFNAHAVKTERFG